MPRHSCLVAVLLAACAGGGDAVSDLVTIDTLPGGIPLVVSTGPVEAGRWSLVHDFDIQPGEGEPGELIAPTDVALGDHNSIYIAESNRNRILVFRADGSFDRSIGRGGGGPGEFNSAWIAVRGDTLAIQDPSQTRGTTIDLNTDQVISIRATACCYWHPIGIDAQGRAVARMMSGDGPPAQPFIRFPMSGESVDTIENPLTPAPSGPIQWIVRAGSSGGGGVMSLMVPLRPTDLIAIDPTGGFVAGWSGAYRIAVINVDGDTTMIFGREYPLIPVTAGQKQALIDEVVASMTQSGMGVTESQLREAFDPRAIPDQHPAFSAVRVDREGRRWVQRSVPDSARVHIDLFDRDGRWLDSLAVPRRDWVEESWQPVALSSDRIVVLREDSDGLPILRVYRVKRN